MKQKKVAIIGAGAAGLTTAWLLEEQYTVVLFEKEQKLGGHVKTVPVTLNNHTFWIDTGFEFFSGDLFPLFNRLLTLLSVQTDHFPLTYTFYNTHHDKPTSSTTPYLLKRPLLLPPWGSYVKISSFCDLVAFSYLKQLYRVIRAFKKIVFHNNRKITLEEFTRTLTFLRPEFIQQFLYPFLVAGWGVSIQEFKKFSAYDIARWCTAHTPLSFKPYLWQEIRDGAHTYITALAGQLATTKLHTNTPITTIRRQENGLYTIFSDTNSWEDIDHVICATNAHQASILLTNIPATHIIRTLLSSITYFTSRIAVHGDSTFMPSKQDYWSVANIRHDGHYGTLTIYKPWKTGNYPIFRSWLTPYDPLPEPLYSLTDYYHACITPSYFEAQQTLATLQGNNNIWLAGLYTNGIDSHESAIHSAVTIAQSLAPNTKNYILLTGKDS